jgi:hypothetical protein
MSKNQSSCNKKVFKLLSHKKQKANVAGRLKNQQPTNILITNMFFPDESK